MSATTKDEHPLQGACLEAEPQTAPAISPKDIPKTTLRAGRWFPEEERYAARLIAEFKNGTLPLPEKMSLREFLSKIFHCHPMRITKKFEGNNMIGKISFRKRGVLTSAAWRELRELERKFWERMVKSKSPSALIAHAKMMDYSSQVYQSGDEGQHFLPAMNACDADPNNSSNMSASSMERRQQQSQQQQLLLLNQCQEMLTQLQNMLQPILGNGMCTNDTSIRVASKKRKLEHNNHTAMANVLTVQKMLSNAKHNFITLKDMAEDANQESQKLLVQSALTRVNAEIDELTTLLHEMNGVTEKQNHENSTAERIEWNTNFNLATANLLTVQQMLHDSLHELFRMEHSLGIFLDRKADDNDIKPLSEMIGLAKQDIQALECQLSSMKEEMQQKYSVSFPFGSLS
ncbi:hypothetical protein HJC23_002524 [Cyclotella cryptica]|uniref:DIRP domain-containing protein n=1 Tax=Cyclotella cryptica TaxID=29204 RepID=A0ABD3QW62_9STRA|eukprot:CCRYP_001355-RA/>CCRYP_001355-RA protein AED:0.00 eAED:0.00 QI:40/-1/1/1/-1/1/1/247/402